MLLLINMLELLGRRWLFKAAALCWIAMQLHAATSQVTWLPLPPSLTAIYRCRWNRSENQLASDLLCIISWYPVIKMNLNIFAITFVISALIFIADADEHNHVVSRRPSSDILVYTSPNIYCVILTILYYNIRVLDHLLYCLP